MKNNRWIPFLLFTMIILAAACQPASDAQADKWAAQNITSYQIQVTEISLWNIQTHTVTVKDGVITEEFATCQPSLLSFDGTCQIEPYEAENFTVPGLFALAQRFMEQDNGEWTTITYNETYYFPADIAYNNPDIYDEEVSWRVDSFEPLP